MKQLIESHRIDAQNGCLLVDQPLAHHIHRHLERRPGSTLAGAGLEHPQLALLHREFDVLHVAIMAFEQVESLRQFGESLRHGLFHARRFRPGILARLPGQILRRADAGDDVLPLRVHKPLAVERLLSS